MNIDVAAIAALVSVGVVFVGLVAYVVTNTVDIRYLKKELTEVKASHMANQEVVYSRIEGLQVSTTQVLLALGELKVRVETHK